MEAKGYSIWMMPNEEIYNVLYSLIKSLSTKYNTPSFEPHITLVHAIEKDFSFILEKFLHLTHSFYKFQVIPLMLKYSDEYFRSIFIEIELSKELIDYHSQAAKLFDQSVGYSYYPHISLIYSNFSLEVKKEITEKIIIPNWNVIRIDKILLVKTIGKVEEWKTVKSLQLKSKSE